MKNRHCYEESQTWMEDGAICIKADKYDKAGAEAKEMLRFISSLAERLDLLRSFSTHSEDCGGSGHSLFAQLFF